MYPFIFSCLLFPIGLVLGEATLVYPFEINLSKHVLCVGSQAEQYNLAPYIS